MLVEIRHVFCIANGLFFLTAQIQTASTLTFTVYFLAMYPHVLTRLREEILAKYGTDRTPTIEDLRELKYLRAVLNGRLSEIFVHRPDEHGCQKHFV